MKGSPTELEHPRQGRATLTPNANELAITINLDRPLEGQLEIVERVAREAQIERHGKTLERRRHRAKWFGYLRALDAKEAGAKLSDMAVQFYRDGVLGRHKSPSGGYCPPPPKAASRLIEAGRTLQFNFPN